MKKILKNIERLSSNQLHTLAVMCGGMAVLVGIAVFIQTTPNGMFAPATPAPASQSDVSVSLPAATYLAGNYQSIPSYSTSAPYGQYAAGSVPVVGGTPMPLNCWAPGSWDYKRNDPIAFPSGPLPYCTGANSGIWNSQPGYAPILGVFSAHAQGSTVGKTDYIQQQYQAASPSGMTQNWPIYNGGDGYWYDNPNHSCNGNTTDCEVQPQTLCDYWTPPYQGDAYCNSAIAGCLNGTGLQGYVGPGCYKPGTPAGDAWPTFSAGAGATVAVSSPLTLEWSCQPTQQESGAYCNGFFGCPPSAPGINGGTPQHVFDNAPTGSGPGFSPNAQWGSKTITAPAVAGPYNYTLTCSANQFGYYYGVGASNPFSVTMTIPVTVTPAVGGTPICTLSSSGNTLNYTITGSSPTAATFSDGHIINNPPASGSYAVSPAVTTNYTMTATNASGTSVPCGPATVVVAAVAPPTATISASKITMTVGDTSVITATFATQQAGDTLTQTAINGPAPTPVPGGYTWTLAPGLSTSPPQNPMTYNFTTNTPGTYTFIPDVQSADAPSWNHSGGQSVVVTVTGVAACPGGQNNPPTCSICDPGFTNVGGVCTLISSCPGDPFAQPPLCSTCLSGYQKVGGICTLIPPTVSLSVVQSRVRKGAPATLNWSVGNLVAGAGESCVISSNPLGVFTQSMPANTAPSWAGSNVQTGNINQTTDFTLSCTNAAPTSVTVGLIPAFQEQ